MKADWIPLFIFLFIFMLACVPQKYPAPRHSLTIPNVLHGTTFNTMVFLKGFTFFFPGSSTGEQRTLCLMGAMEQLRVFEKHWGSKSKRCVVFLFPTKTVKCGDKRGKFWGCCHRPNGPIYIVMGKYYSASVFYHELVHLNDTGKDHDDPRWDSFWKPEQWKLFERISEGHRRLLRK